MQKGYSELQNSRAIDFSKKRKQTFHAKACLCQIASSEYFNPIQPKCVKKRFPSRLELTEVPEGHRR